MKKSFTLLFLCIAACAAAQTTNNGAFGIGAELNLPANDSYVLGIGISGKLELPVAGMVSLTATAGYNVNFRQNQFLYSGGGKPRSLTVLPLKLGLRYYFVPKFYAEGEAGTTIRVSPGSHADLALAGGAGYILKLKQNSLDFGARVEYWQEYFTLVALRAAYRFSVK